MRVVESSLCKSTGCGLQSIAVELCYQTKKQHLFSVTPSFTSARSSDRDDYCRGNRFHIHLCKMKITSLYIKALVIVSFREFDLGPNICQFSF